MPFTCQECSQELPSAKTKHTYLDCLRYKHKVHDQVLRRDLTHEDLIKDLKAFRRCCEANNEWLYESLLEACIRLLEQKEAKT
jgi:hypothetical protein